MTARILYGNVLSLGTLAATTTASGFQVRSLLDWRTYTKWRSSDTSTQYLTVNCGSAKTADALGVAAHNLADVGASVSVEYSSDNFVGDVNEALAAFVATSGPILKTFTPRTAQYWRLKITGLTAACEVAIATLGQVLTFPEHIHGEYTPVRKESKSEAEVSEKGHLLGVVTSFTQISSKVEFQFLTDTWFRNTFEPAWDAHLGKFIPFFWQHNVELAPGDVFLMRVKPGTDLDAKYQLPNTRRLDLDLIGLLLT